MCRLETEPPASQRGHDALTNGAPGQAARCRLDLSHQARSLASWTAGASVRRQPSVNYRQAPYVRTALPSGWRSAHLSRAALRTVSLRSSGPPFSHRALHHSSHCGDPSHSYSRCYCIAVILLLLCLGRPWEGWNGCCERTVRPTQHVAVTLWRCSQRQPLSWCL